MNINHKLQQLFYWATTADGEFRIKTENFDFKTQTLYCFLYYFSICYKHTNTMYIAV